MASESPPSRDAQLHTMSPTSPSSPTEAILESARELDKLSVKEALELMHKEDAVAYKAVGLVLPDIAEAVEVLVCSLRGGGRWFNVGAGTSGRMGVLDSSEIPPTFGMSPQTVQGVIAGGDRALREAIEGAEDNAAAASFELHERGLRMGDAVVAISASGRTPFALGAFEAAHEAGARRIAITCAPGSALAEAAEIAIVPQTGPEVVAGSTRLKGGLSQKMVLHLLSTTVMVQLGRVSGNLMTNISPLSEKLRTRAVGIVMQLGGVDAAEAEHLLHQHDNRIEAALRATRARR
jgi:N-acetylmuramic acid 6-phosphate etherase